MSIWNTIKERIFKNEISADTADGNGFEKLMKWWGIDSEKPKAIAEVEPVRFS